MRKLLILPALLLLAYPAPAQVLPSVSVSTTAVAQTNGPVEVQGDLISTFPPGKTKAEAGRLFVFVLNGDLPYTITPKVPTLDSVNAEGKRVVMLAAPESDFTLSVSFQVVHPTPEEKAKARSQFVTGKTADKVDWIAYDEFLDSVSKDEVFQDSVTVTVGEPEPPKPPPGPEPPSDPLARKVYDAAIKHNLPAEECKTVSENMRAVVAEAVATSISREEITGKIKAKNLKVTSGKANWEAWEKELPGIFTVSTRDDAIKAYDKIADGLGAVK